MNAKQEKHKESLPRHIIIKLLRTGDEEKILKTVRGRKCITSGGTKIRRTAEFSLETMQATRYAIIIFKLIKKKKYQPRVLYPENISFRFLIPI